MAADRRARAARGSLRTGSLDFTDLVVVAVGIVLVAAFGVYAGFAHAGRQAAVPEFRMPAPSATPTPTESGPPNVVLIGSGRENLAALASGLGRPGGAVVTRIVGGGYTAAERSFTSVASSIGERSTLVVVVTPAADASAGSIALVKEVSRTVAALKKAAPNAGILLVGPVAPPADGPALQPLRDAVHGAAAATDQHWFDPISRKLVGAGQVDATGAVTAEGLQAVGKGLVEEVRSRSAG